MGISALLASVLTLSASHHVLAVPHGSLAMIRRQAPGMPHDPYAPCTFWWDNEGLVSCEAILDGFRISIEEYMTWNPSITPDCGNFLVGRSYCVEAPRAQTTSTTTTAQPPTTTAGNGIETPSPTQTGMVKNCNKFKFVDDNTDCQSILDEFGLSLDDFSTWNPAVLGDCSKLWKGTNACVGIIGGGGSPTAPTTKPPTTTKTSENGIETPEPIQPGMVKNCNKFHPVTDTTTCRALLDYNKISLPDFHKWNPAVKDDCSGLQKGTNACVGVVGGTTTAPPTTTTKASENGIETPLPIQPGMVKNCNKFHPIRDTTTCQALLDYNKISLTDFHKWNPDVKDDCSNLQKGTNACVAVIGGATTTKAPAPTTTKPANGIETPSPIQSGMVKNCNKFHDIKSTTTCSNLLSYNEITMEDLFKWNPGVKSDCTGLQAGTWACVGVIGGTTTTTKAPAPAPTTTKPANGIETPSPIQSGMVKDCNKFHDIKETTTCANLLSYNKITLADLFKWNPGVKNDCTGLQAGTWACVGVIGGTTAAPAPTTTKAGNGIKTPLPIQTGMVTNCKKFHYISKTTTCAALLSYEKITMEQLFKWNPAVKKDCSGLWEDTNACVGV